MNALERLKRQFVIVTNSDYARFRCVLKTALPCWNYLNGKEEVLRNRFDAIVRECAQLEAEGGQLRHDGKATHVGVALFGRGFQQVLLRRHPPSLIEQGLLPGQMPMQAALALLDNLHVPHDVVGACMHESSYLEIRDKSEVHRVYLLIGVPEWDERPDRDVT